MQNGFVERFDGSLRKGVLDMYVFRTLTEVRERADEWLRLYNEEIVHESTGMLTPVECRLKHAPENRKLWVALIWGGGHRDWKESDETPQKQKARHCRAFAVSEVW